MSDISKGFSIGCGLVFGIIAALIFLAVAPFACIGLMVGTQHATAPEPSITYPKEKIERVIEPEPIDGALADRLKPGMTELDVVGILGPAREVRPVTGHRTLTNIKIYDLHDGGLLGVGFNRDKVTYIHANQTP